MKKKTKALAFLLFLSLSFYSKDKLKNFLSNSNIDYKNKTIILIGLNGNDCVNCYRGISDFILKLEQANFKELFIIAGGINEREKAAFLKNNFSNKINFDNLIINHEFSYFLNKHSSSSILLVKNGKVIKSHEAKTLINFDYTQLSKSQKTEEKKITLVDSIDVSSKILSKISKAEYMGNNNFILTDYRNNKIYSLEKSSQIYDSIDVGSYLNENYKVILNKILGDSTTINNSINLESKMDGFYNGNHVHFLSTDIVDDKIYVSYRLLYLKNYKDFGAMGVMLPFVLVLDKTLKPVENIVVPPFDIRDTTTYFDLINPHFNKNHGIFRITSGKSEQDTLMALFRIGNSVATLEKYYNHKLKSHIPKKGSNGYPMFYYFNFHINNEDTFIYTSKDYTLKNLNKNSEIEIPIFKKDAISNENFSLNLILNNGDKKFIWSHHEKNVSTFSYFTADFKTLLNSYKSPINFNSVGQVKESFFYGLSVNDKYSKLYFFKLN